jgi:hypothetical protein
MSVSSRSGVAVLLESPTEALIGKTLAVSWALTETIDARTREAKSVREIDVFISRGRCFGMGAYAPLNLKTRKCPIVRAFLKPRDFLL